MGGTHILARKDTMVKAARVPQIFHVGEKVIVKSTILGTLSGKRGVISHVRASIYAHTLDKYTVQIDGEPDAILWDIELQRET
jgi:hypothetical protein